ncbi:hypothetical protein G7046_g3421 [Stylonectria norvegica]|nr:hypothetical protein G7046_g3421 [Stylonectria norvegica]
MENCHSVFPDQADHYDVPSHGYEGLDLDFLDHDASLTQGLDTLGSCNDDNSCLDQRCFDHYGNRTGNEVGSGHGNGPGNSIAFDNSNAIDMTLDVASNNMDFHHFSQHFNQHMNPQLGQNLQHNSTLSSLQSTIPHHSDTSHQQLRTSFNMPTNMPNHWSQGPVFGGGGWGNLFEEPVADSGNAFSLSAYGNNMDTNMCNNFQGHANTTTYQHCPSVDCNSCPPNDCWDQCNDGVHPVCCFDDTCPEPEADYAACCYDESCGGTEICVDESCHSASRICTDTNCPVTTASTTPASASVTTPPQVELDPVIKTSASPMESGIASETLITPRTTPVCKGEPQSMSQEDQYMCRWLCNGLICGKQFLNDEELQNHCKCNHLKNLQKVPCGTVSGFNCSWNGCKRTEAFSQKSKLERHLQTHTGCK